MLILHIQSELSIKERSFYCNIRAIFGNTKITDRKKYRTHYSYGLQLKITATSVAIEITGEND